MSSLPGNTERIHTVVIGGGQAGLSVGYHLKKRDVPFLILEANNRIGDSWRKRWDSLHLFTPALYDSIDGLPFPAPPYSFPSKDDMADYLESYAKHFDLPVRTGLQVERLSKPNGKFEVLAGDRTIEADNVVVRPQEALLEEARASSLFSLFMPGGHYSARGNEIIAGTIAQHILTMKNRP